MSATLEQKVDALLAEVRELRAVVEGPQKPEVTTALLNGKNAAAYVQKSPGKSFYRWRKKWGVRYRSYGRYSRGDLDLALSREAGLVRTPASLRRNAA